MNVAAAAVMLALASLVGWLAPAAVMRALLPTAEPGPLLVENHRGRKIPPVLGIVWLVWALGLLLVQVCVDFLVRAGWEVPGAEGLIERLATTPLALPFFVVPLILVAGALALGLADDAFGAGGPKGFRGHLAALRGGRISTGMLKMLGIGVLAIFYGATAATFVLERSDPEGASVASPGWHLAAWALCALVIALSANLVNLLDLRPGRALKAYIVLAPAPAVAFAVASVAEYNDDAASFAAEIAGVVLQPWESAVVAVGLLIVLLGPVLAVWKADLGERAMLGDAGANTMGVIIGYLLTATLDLVGLAIAAVVLLGLNVASERVSFTSTIDRIPVLAFLDRVGRREPAPDARKDPPEATPLAGSVRYHSDEDPGNEED